MRIEFKLGSYLRVFKHPLMGISLVQWFNMLWRQGGRIHPAFWLRTFVLLITAIGNSPFHLFEWLRYGQKVKKQAVKRPVFILGHPRSGTTHLHYLMSKDPQFAYCTVYDAIVPHLMLSGGKWIKSLIASSLPPTRPQDEVSVTIDAPKEEEFALATLCGSSYMNCFYFPSSAQENFERSVAFKTRKDKVYWQRHFSFFLRKLSLRYDNKPLLLKSPANTGRVAEILELYPDAVFIHISRHPYEVYLSTIGLYEKIVPLTCFQKPSPEALDAFIIASYRSMHQKYAKAREGLSDRQLIEVKYEDLLREPLHVLTKIYEQLDLSLDDAALAGFSQELERTRDYAKNRYAEIPESLKERLRSEWTDAFELFAYKS